MQNRKLLRFLLVRQFERSNFLELFFLLFAVFTHKINNRLFQRVLLLLLMNLLISWYLAIPFEIFVVNSLHLAIISCVSHFLCNFVHRLNKPIVQNRIPLLDMDVRLLVLLIRLLAPQEAPFNESIFIEVFIKEVFVKFLWTFFFMGQKIVIKYLIPNRLRFIKHYWLIADCIKFSHPF